MKLPIVLKIYSTLILFLFFVPRMGSSQWKEIAVIGGSGTEPGKFSSPRAISADADGNLYVADTENHRIQKFDPRGSFIKTAGGYGWQKDQFNLPIDISAQSGLNVFIADYQNHRIQRYDKDLNFLSSFDSPSPSSFDLTFWFPSGIVLTGRGDLFVSDRDNQQIVKINQFGKADFRFGNFDAGKGIINQPGQIEWVKEGDRLFICDRGKNRIGVFDYFGNFLRSLSDGKIDNPAGLFVENEDAIWVCEPHKNMISQFNFHSDKTDSISAKNPFDLTRTSNGYWIISGDQIKLFQKN